MRILAGTLIMILTLLMPLQASAGIAACLNQHSDTMMNSSMDESMDHSCCQNTASDTQCQCDQISAPSLIGADKISGLMDQNLRPAHHLTYFHPSLNYQPERPPQIS